MGATAAMRRKWFCSASAIAAIALVIAGCSSSSSSTSAASATSSASNAAPAATSGAASGAPIDIGFGQALTGTASFPGLAQGAQVAAKYLNATEAGLDGHPINLEVCDMMNTPQASQACGEQFANNSSIHLVMMGSGQAGGPFYQAIAPTGKPILGGINSVPADDTAVNTYFYLPGGNALRAAEASNIESILSSSSNKNLVYVNQDVTSANNGAVVVQGLLKGTDVKFTDVKLETNATDVLPALTAGKVSSAALVYLFTSGDCPPIAQALHTIGYKGKVVALSTCMTSQNLTQTPALYSGWTIISPYKIAAAGKGVDPDIDAFLAAWSKYGSGTTTPFFAEVGWEMILSAKAALANLSYAQLSDDAALSAALKAFTGPVPMGPSSIKCPGPASTPTNCAQSAVFYTVQPNGSLKTAGS
jgi:branched-chain amino acid transport system substrate-binding protein